MMKEIKMFPKVHFIGGANAMLLSCIYAETLDDLVNKYEDGRGNYPKGFLHTSTYEHGGTCYYKEMWSRDCGRGVIELVGNGFIREAEAVVDYFLSHITNGDSWSREIHAPNSTNDQELDGNALILLSIYIVWKRVAHSRALEFIDKLMPVLKKFCGDIHFSATGLLQSISELSANPCVEYGVYGVLGNYSMLLALKAMDEMATYAGKDLPFLKDAVNKLTLGLQNLVSDGVHSKAPAGCWLNGLDSRDMSVYDTADFAGVICDFSASTRIIPFIFEYDYKELSQFCDIHKASYRYLKEKMAEGYYFRKYGFVSNTAWSGIGGRHDDSMAGYGQGFFTQAALYMDDVNCYSKCLEGIARLGYDGNVIDVLSDGEISPFIMHECFHYENYEKALDHTFGALSEGRENVMNNRGDEGNLVQAAENLKAIRMSLGIRAEGKTLVVAPKLPWLSEGVEVSDFPVFTEKGMVRIGLKYSMLRYNRRAELVLTSGAENFQNVVVRFGPFSLSLKEENVQKSENAKWVIKKFNIGERMVFEY